MEHKELINWIRLINSNSIGPISFYKLSEKYGSVQDALEYLDKDKIFSIKEAEEEVEKANQKGIRIIGLNDNEYPESLKNLNDAPPLLYVKGNIDLLNYPICISIVGARNASIASRKIASKISFDLTNNDILVISGMARGIDSAAHKGALYAKNQSGPTIAVLGSGVDIVYPAENQELYEQICNFGAIVSEYPLGTLPQTSNFPRRNRLVSAFSSAILVVEASLNSGSLITAKLGLEQGKDIFAVPSSPIDGKSAGSNKLIKEGAILTESADDILDVLQYTQSLKIKSFENKKTTLFANPLDKVKKSDNIPVKIKKTNVESLIGLIGENGIEIDELIRLSGSNANEIMAKITELELDGTLERINTNTLILKH